MPTRKRQNATCQELLSPLQQLCAGTLCSGAVHLRAFVLNVF